MFCSLITKTNYWINIKSWCKCRHKFEILLNLELCWVFSLWLILLFDLMWVNFFFFFTYIIGLCWQILLKNSSIYIIKGFRTIVFIFIVISTMFRPIKMKTIVWKPLMIKINKLCLRNLDFFFYLTLLEKVVFFFWGGISFSSSFLLSLL